MLVWHAVPTQKTTVKQPCRAIAGELNLVQDMVMSGKSVRPDLSTSNFNTYIAGMSGKRLYDCFYGCKRHRTKKIPPRAQ